MKQLSILWRVNAKTLRRKYQIKSRQPQATNVRVRNKPADICDVKNELEEGCPETQQGNQRRGRKGVQCFFPLKKEVIKPYLA